MAGLAAHGASPQLLLCASTSTQGFRATSSIKYVEELGVPNTSTHALKTARCPIGDLDKPELRLDAPHFRRLAMRAKAWSGSMAIWSRAHNSSARA